MLTFLFGLNSNHSNQAFRFHFVARVPPNDVIIKKRSSNALRDGVIKLVFRRLFVRSFVCFFFFVFYNFLFTSLFPVAPDQIIPLITESFLRKEKKNFPRRRRAARNWTVFFLSFTTSN